MIYLASLMVGVGVGLAYGLIGLRSPAPPMAALLGLLGMLAGENGVAMVKRSIAARAHQAHVETQAADASAYALPSRAERKSQRSDDVETDGPSR